MSPKGPRPGAERRWSPLLAVAAAAALSACSTVGQVGDAVWPFGDDADAKAEAADDGRISILPSELKLEPDPELAGRTPLTPAPLPAVDWSQPGGAPDNAPQHVAIAGALDVAWRADAGDGSSRRTRIAAPPVIADGRLFVLDADQQVRAIDAATGKALWRRAFKPEGGRDRTAVGGGVATADGRVYAVNGFGVAAAFDAATGAPIWRSEAGSPFASAPTVVGGRMFAVTTESELMAFDVATGGLVWSHQAIAETARILSASSAAVVGDTVIAPFPSGEIIALQAANGRRLWVDALTRTGRSTSLSAINDVAGRPAVVGGIVYAASHSGVLAAIEQRSGQRIWARPFASTQTPWVSGDTVFAVNVDGELAALERTTGQPFWVTQLQRFRDQEDRKGRIAWAGPILVGGKLFLASSEGEAAVVDPATGALERTVKLGGPVFVPPVAAGGFVYVLTDEGRLVALK